MQRFLFLLTILFATAALADTPVCVKKNEATWKSSMNPRAAANVSTLAKYTPLKYTGQSDKGWLQVQDNEGHTGWVQKKDLSYSLKCLTVTVDKSRMRKGPGKDFPAGALAMKGDNFLDLGGEDGWTQVQNPKGEKSWINLDHTWKPTARMRMSFDGR